MLTIISGRYKGRRIIAPRGTKTRPTSSRVREALFSILGSRVNQATVLDLFAGSGAMGLEAMSRGAASVFFVDKSAMAVAVVKQNCQTLNIENFQISKRDVSVFLKSKQDGMGFELIFADPPYRQGFPATLLPLICQGNWLKSDGLLIVEEDASANLPERIGCLQSIDLRKYGDTGLYIYRPIKENEYEGSLSREF